MGEFTARIGDPEMRNARRTGPMPNTSLPLTLAATPFTDRPGVESANADVAITRNPWGTGARAELGRTDLTSASRDGIADGVLPLETLLRGLPPRTRLPAGWVLQRLAEERAHAETRRTAAAEARSGDAAAPAESAWLTTKEFGALHVPRRTAEWVADRCRDGSIPGADKNGDGTWRVPRAALGTPVRRRRSAAGVCGTAADARRGRSPRASADGGADPERSGAPASAIRTPF